MIVPKVVRHYCPKCKKHTDFKVSIYKKSETREQAKGQRRYEKKQRGYGTQSKPVFHKNAKVNKCFLPLLTCQECKKKMYGRALRMKKYEIQ
ncbi:MAG TPA: 50S ribosomal protein L44e [Candidatus Lokiarchaeia archaeon]|nr:50S ribosomal protein L44e [Candidatus Lokiarchaeia archaeon]